MTMSARNEATRGGKMPETERTDFSLQILLPQAVEARLRQWVDEAPGATWPAWGGHITLINRFAPLCAIKVIRREISDVVKAFSPFTLRLAKVVRSDHWQRPDLQTVLLTSESTSDAGFRTLLRLHGALRAALDPLKTDLAPAVSQRPFAPHISLTWGISTAAAIHLAELAMQAGLVAEFRVQRLHLLEFIDPPDPKSSLQVCNQTPFVLGQGAPLEDGK